MNPENYEVIETKAKPESCTRRGRRVKGVEGEELFCQRKAGCGLCKVNLGEAPAGDVVAVTSLS